MEDHATCDITARHGLASLRGVPLVCPRDHEPLAAEGGALHCPRCRTAYPIRRGTPVLIRDENSVFAIADYGSDDAYEGAAYGREADRAGGLRRRYRRVMRWLGDAPSSVRRPSAEDAVDYVRALAPEPRVLVIGAGGVRLGRDTDRVVQTDVAFAPHVDAIADAHDLPFPAGSFDLVVAVAVLEHVAEPTRCVAEITRVLAPGGHVFAVTPFLQPVHMGAYDFTRFTAIGHRRLFRQFDEVAAGVAMGTGSAAASALRSLLESVSRNRAWRAVATGGALLATPPLRLLDRLLPHAADGASGLWFFGQRREGPPVTDRWLVQRYRDGFGVGAHKLPPPRV